MSINVTGISGCSLVFAVKLILAVNFNFFLKSKALYLCICSMDGMLNVFWGGNIMFTILI